MQNEIEDEHVFRELESMIKDGLVMRNLDGTLSYTELGKKTLDWLADEHPHLYAEIFRAKLH